MAQAFKNSLSHYLYMDEKRAVEGLLKGLAWDEVRAGAVRAQARALVERIRLSKQPPGQLESFLQQYSLTTQEGLALMTLAEALLRIPDRETVNALIKDKVMAANWLDGIGQSKDWVVKAAGVGLLMTRKTLQGALSNLGEPVIREAMIKAMRIMGQQFVLGRDIDEARLNAKPYEAQGYRMSYDMLGEGARTAIDAERYFDEYADAITNIGKNTSDDAKVRPGVSVKLSALHPRYEYAQAEDCVPALSDKLKELVTKALAHNIALTVDAEEVDRLELSLKIIENILAQQNLQDWDGFGLAVQAYQKRAYPLIDHIAGLAQQYKTRMQVRLVKGAYWDTEVKRAQVEGLPDYPLFTRKASTDVSYLACAHKLFQHADHFYPMFGTHNAHTVAAILELSKESETAAYEFQRLHGMGESLYRALMAQNDLGGVTVYAPVGPHEDLLPYLVRRLLENGANSSFVNKLLDKAVPVEELIADPVEKIRGYAEIHHPRIPLPEDLYAREPLHGRRNSKGIDLTEKTVVKPLLKNIAKYNNTYDAASIIGGKVLKEGKARENQNPANKNDNLGLVFAAGPEHVDQAFVAARAGFKTWSRIDAEDRAGILERAADLMEEHRDELMAILQREGGKITRDGRDEIREAVDFCRYYANRGRSDFSSKGMTLPGPTGESNRLTMHGRGVFVCISPWNFPLAIFTGQIVAALMAGNAVIAKPASQTPLIAMKAVELLHKAGVPKKALNLMVATGAVGGKLVEHPDTAGVAFTGSTEVAWSINRALAAKDGPIVPLIAETGGQNAMIVDSSALPEQVVDDVVLSAFGSAGQRCSALRILCLQEEIADKILRMLKGAMAELRLGDPAKLRTDVGPVIDEGALAELIKHRTKLNGIGNLVYEVPRRPEKEELGHFFVPCAYEIDGIDVLSGEVFGPILHIVRYERARVLELIKEINATGYGLTFGVHSRIAETQEALGQAIEAGNVYVNRSMIGAVVGSQPFGGMGISGTGPKAGGPHYLPRFAHEKVTSIDTTAAGGNASLVSIEE